MLFHPPQKATAQCSPVQPGAGRASARAAQRVSYKSQAPGESSSPPAPAPSTITSPFRFLHVLGSALLFTHFQRMAHFVQMFKRSERDGAFSYDFKSSVQSDVLSPVLIPSVCISLVRSRLDSEGHALAFSLCKLSVSPVPARSMLLQQPERTKTGSLPPSPVPPTCPVWLGLCIFLEPMQRGPPPPPSPTSQWLISVQENTCLFKNISEPHHCLPPGVQSPFSLPLPCPWPLPHGQTASPLLPQQLWFCLRDRPSFLPPLSPLLQTQTLVSLFKRQTCVRTK